MRTVSSLKPELWVERLRSDDIVRELLDEVPTPPVQRPLRDDPGGEREAAGLSVLAGLGLIGALVLGRPELAAVAAPFAVLVGVGLTLARPPELRVIAELERERQLEGRQVLADLELRSSRSVWRLELLLELPAGLETEEPNPRLIRLATGERRSIEMPLRCSHWGAYEVGRVLWRARDRFGLVTFEGSAASRATSRSIRAARRSSGC